MHEVLVLALVLISGIVLGGLFFGGLWWTVGKGTSSERPALWFLGSLVLRTGVLLTGFYFVAHAHWERLVISVLGFIIARVIVTRFTKPVTRNGPVRLKREVCDAP